ncbi:MAG: hypothetical protein ACYDHH_04065 [Solirubrobacteraceae bacterium]
MYRTVEPASRTAQVVFELEQFEVIDGDRCEVRGRWLGVRGRRFLRPALTVTVDGRSRRLLADLAGKPWAAEDGGLWHASFPCELTDTELVEAELTVAPDLTVALQSRRPTSSESEPVADRAARVPAPHTTDESHTRATPSPFERRSRADAGERLRRELVDARTEQRRLQNQVNHLRAEKADTAQRITELIVQAGEVKQELDAVTRAREQLTAERQQQRAKLEGVAAARDEALLHLDEMTAKYDAARYDYNELVRKLNATERARQQTLADRDHASADPDAAKAPPNAAIANSAGPARVAEQPQSAPANLLTIRDTATLARRTTYRPAARSYAQSFRQAAPAVVLLMITLLVALIVLRP